MKRSGVLLLGLCLLGVAGCGDDSTAPSNLPIVMTANLSPANEVPPIANPENTGFGTVQITFNVTRDGTGAITAGTADFHFQLSGFPSNTSIVLAHIHTGGPAVNGGCPRQHGHRRCDAGDADGWRDDLQRERRFGSRRHTAEHREQSSRLLLQRALADQPGRGGARATQSHTVIRASRHPGAGPDLWTRRV